MKAWILWHKYADGSAAHIERVYLDFARGAEDLALTKATSDVGGSGNWLLDEVTVVGPTQPALFPIKAAPFEQIGNVTNQLWPTGNK